MALVTAVCAPLLLLVVGFVADFGYASYVNQCLARATDAATVGSVSQTAATAGGGYGNLSFLQTTGVTYFNSNIAQLGLTGVNFTLSVVSDGSGGVISTGNYSYNVPTFFSTILGFSTIPVSGNAKTMARPLTYINYYILVDTSQSMGIGSTQADMTALYQRVLNNNNARPDTDGGCVFGCHVKQNLGGNYGYQKVSNEDLAHNPQYGTPLTLRIDSAVTAVTNIIQSAAQIASSNKNIKFGLYTIGQDPTTGKRVQFLTDPPTSDYNALQSTASTIDLGTTLTSSNSGDTNFHSEFSDFLSGLKTAMAQGSGASATSPLNYVFLITDGLNDVNGNCAPYGICTAPIDPNDCATLRANATLGVIYTTYSPIYKFNTPPNLETRYQYTVDGKPPQISANLQSCASSSDWYFEASDGPALVSAVQTLFQRTQPISARIAQ